MICSCLFLSYQLHWQRPRIDMIKIKFQMPMYSYQSAARVISCRRDVCLDARNCRSKWDHGCVPQDLRRQLEAQGARSPDVWSVLLTLQNTLPPTSLATGQIKRGENTPESFNSLTQSQRLHIIGSKLFGIFWLAGFVKCVNPITFQFIIILNIFMVWSCTGRIIIGI